MKEICKGCKKFGVRKGCYRGCDSMPKNNLKEKPMKSKTLQKKIEKLEIEPNIVEVGTEWSSVGNYCMKATKTEKIQNGYKKLPSYQEIIFKINELIEAVNNLNSNENK